MLFEHLLRRLVPQCLLRQVLVVMPDTAVQGLPQTLSPVEGAALRRAARKGLAAAAVLCGLMAMNITACGAVIGHEHIVASVFAGHLRQVAHVHVHKVLVTTSLATHRAIAIPEDIRAAIRDCSRHLAAGPASPGAADGGVREAERA